MSNAITDFARCTVLWLKLARMRIRARGGNRLAILSVAACSALLTACGFLPQALIVPIPTLQDSAQANVRAKRLIVMLPGIFDKANDYLKAGFVKDLRSRGIDADVIIPEAHFGYYETREVQIRLETDVFAPARAQGYKEIWIVGVSLGGLGSLLYSAQHADRIAGILLIAPFPGSEAIQAEMKQSGGPLAWSKTPLARGADERYALRWLADISHAQTDRPTAVTQVFLGTGKSDRFFAGQRTLSELLPAQRVFFVEGGHDWTAWRKIWIQFLDNGPWALEAAKRAELDRIKL